LYSKNLYLLPIAFTNIAYGGYINIENIDKSKYSVELTSCDSYYCIEKLENKFQNENYYLEYIDNRYIFKLVNIEDKTKLNKLLSDNNHYKPTTIAPIVNKEVVKKNKTTKTTDPKQQILQNYTKALNLYKQKKYQDAYINFNKLFEQNLDDVNINFYLGRSAFELKKYHEAIIAFDRVLFSNPDSSRAKLEIARAYFNSKQFGEAKKYFLELKTDTKVPQNIILVVDKFLAIIDKNTQKNFLNGVLLAGINYDSNINTSSTYSYFTDDPYLEVLKNQGVIDPTSPNTTQRDNDWAHQEVAILNHKYVYDDKNIFKNDFMYFTKVMNNHKNSAKDIDMVSFTPTLSASYTSKLTVDYSVFIDKLYIDDSSNLKTYGIFPKFTYILGKNIITKGYLKYQKKYNTDKTLSKNDSKYIEISNSWQYIASPKLNYSFDFIYSTESQKNHQLNNTIDKDSYNLKLNSTYMLNKKISLSPAFSYKYTKYKEDDIQYLKNIANSEYKLSLMNTYIHSAKWLFQVGGDYTKQDSNVMKNIYNKHTFTFNIIRPF